MFRIRRTFLHVSVLVLLGACSATKLAYNNADDLIYWWLDGYLDFRTEQVAPVRAAISGLHRWHRTHELPEYISLLERMQRLAQGNVSAEQACDLFNDATTRVRVSLDQAVPPIAVLAPQLDAAQLARLQQRYDTKNREWRDEWADVAPEKRDRQRLERLEDNVERFYVRLGPPQIAVLKELVTATPFETEMIYREIRRRQADTIAALQRLRTAPPDEAQEGAHGLVQRWRDPGDIDYQRYLDRIQALSCAAFARMHNTTSPQQRQDLAERLRNYSDDLRALAAQAR